MKRSHVLDASHSNYCSSISLFKSKLQMSDLDIKESKRREKPSNTNLESKAKQGKCKATIKGAFSKLQDSKKENVHPLGKQKQSASTNKSSSSLVSSQ